MTAATAPIQWAQTIQAVERTQLVRFCARRTGDPDVAEDLAQETLIEAWRHADRLADPDARTPWLFGIARNVCRRWLRASGREAAHRAQALDELPGDGDDPVLELERDELAELLDQALALLPPPTRTLLLRHYVDGLPQAELARRLDLSEGAVAVRIHRGKLTLRRLLASGELDGERTDDGWQETRIWCPNCGRRRLWGRFGPENTTFSLRCPDCHPDRAIHLVHGEHTAGELAGLTTYKPAFSRVMAWAIDFYRPGLATGRVHCHRCGRPAVLHRHLPEEIPLPWRDEYGIHFRCPCHATAFDAALSALTLWLPAGRRFWHEHPRIRRLPDREIEANGRPAILSSFESVTDAARYDVVSARDTFELLGIYGDSAA
ncbi:MAG TPA: RNA polymerase sigma factor [Thermomicrobiales bacterium]|nr:RNA polymerase sigma factor [Thermomicrobiales bacterium]